MCGGGWQDFVVWFFMCLIHLDDGWGKWDGNFEMMKVASYDTAPFLTGTFF